jgi:hypothetical protein
MADDKQIGTGPGGSSIILILAAAASALYLGWRAPPLVSTRPAAPDYHIHEIAGTQDIDARLWQDPFAAALQAVGDERGCNPKTPAAHSVANLTKVFQDKQYSTLALAVTLPGAPYPEIVETRRRLRYAILAALHVEKFEPEDEKHIGYWRTDADDALPAQNNSPQANAVPQISRTSANQGGKPGCGAPPNVAAVPIPPVVPFESFRDLEKKKRVVVLWIDEDFLSASQKPLKTFTQLIRASKSDVKFALAGPTDSTTLRSMAASNVDQWSTDKPQFSVYNFGATVEEKNVWLSKDPETKDLQNHFTKLGIRYYRTVNTDRDLAERLVPELQRRGLNLDTVPMSHSIYDSSARSVHRDHIALISEWDTVYGKYLQNSIKDAFAETANNGKPQSGEPDWILRFSYLRGLDGRLPDRRGITKGGVLTRRRANRKARCKPPRPQTPRTSSKAPKDKASSIICGASPATCITVTRRCGEPGQGGSRRLASSAVTSTTSF